MVARLKSTEVVGEPKIDPTQISEKVARFILEFEKRFEDAPIFEKKLLIKKVISEIIVDREEEVVRFYVRRLPITSPEVENLLEKRGLSTEIASPRSSGGRT